MGTSALVYMTDSSGEVIRFFRGHDGYPERGALPTLKRLMLWVAEGKVRDNISQTSPWLILLGHEEIADPELGLGDVPTGGACGWKASSWEYAIDGNYCVDYEYHVNLSGKVIEVFSVSQTGPKKLIKTLNF